MMIYRNKATGSGLSSMKPRIQRRLITTKRRWFRTQCPHHRFIIEDVISIHAFDRFEEERHVKRFQCHFRLVDLPTDALYALATPTIHDGL